VIQGIDNIGICTTDVARAIAFYQRLGFLETCPYRKSNSDVLMVQSSEVRLGNDAANGLNLPRNRCILV
jgi:hypothetical protein